MPRLILINGITWPRNGNMLTLIIQKQDCCIWYRKTFCLKKWDTRWVHKEQFKSSWIAFKLYCLNINSKHHDLLQACILEYNQLICFLGTMREIQKRHMTAIYMRFNLDYFDILRGIKLIISSDLLLKCDATLVRWQLGILCGYSAAISN